jgi:DNA-binding NtrC family response regulator
VDVDPTLQAQDAPSGPARLCLLVVAPDFVRTYPLTEGTRLSIGRAPGSDVYLEDPLISRAHAALHVGERLEIEDLGSANRTRLRGQPLPEGRTRLVPGDVVDLGASMLIVQRSAEQEPRRRLVAHGDFELRLQDECARQTHQRRSPFAVLRVQVEGRLTRTQLEAALTAELRAGDMIGSYAPGEYELLLVNSVRSRGERAARALEARLQEAGASARVGLAVHPEDGLTADALIGRAAPSARGGRPNPPAEGPVVEDPAMRELYRVVERVARGTISLLLLGETGVGKEIVAEAIHRLSPRKGRPFVRLNCAALSETLVESELFGHEKGAFTGAESAKPGLIEEAQGGTVFLDEVGELPLGTQAKLLRVLEQRELHRVGGLKPRPIDVRFVAATNRDLDAEVAAGRFRADLLYRLNGASLRVPPLRERTAEIAPLARLFAARAADGLGLDAAPALSAEALTRLEAYSWPGNIRELRNMMERAVLLGGESIGLEHLPLDKLAAVWTAAPARGGSSMRDRILEALEANAHNQTRAAEQLGVSRQTLSTWLDRYDIPRPRRRG